MFWQNIKIRMWPNEFIMETYIIYHTMMKQNGKFVYLSHKKQYYNNKKYWIAPAASSLLGLTLKVLKYFV